MATFEQTKNSPTNNNTQSTPISFDDVSLEMLQKSFNDTYKVSKGSSSQVVLGFQSMASRLQDPQNEYQQELYPRLKEMCMNLYNKYNHTFLTKFSNEVERQVYGANLNGNRNSGSLYRSIPSGVNRNLTYNYAQFGQLLRVLSGRLRFVVNRDVESVQRYKDSRDESLAYQSLQTKCTEFLKYLETLSTEWDTFVKSTRTKHAVEEPERKDRQDRQPRNQFTQFTQFTPFTQRSERTHSNHSNHHSRHNSQNAHFSSSERSQKEYKPVRKANSSNEEEWQEVRPKRQQRTN